MAITISGQNNNDKILASDGVLDSISGFNVVGVMTATQFDVTTKHTANHIDVGSSIQLGNAGIITATTLIGNVTGNVNSTSHLLLQISGSEKFRVGNGGQLGIGGANYGTSGQVLTSGGSGSAASWSTIASDKITEGNTEAEVYDVGSNTSRFTVKTEGSERLRVSADGNLTVGAAVTISPVGNINATGIITATSFSGSGANLTSLPAQATIANNADNRVITGGSGVNLNGEANLTFDGSTLGITKSSDGSIIQTRRTGNTSGGGAELRVTDGFSSTSPVYSFWYNNTTGIGNPAANTTSFINGGSGSSPSWTTITGTTINSNTNNYLVTATGTANTLNGEASLQFDGTSLTVKASKDIRFENGGWTGEYAGKIQHNSNNLYIQGGSGGFRFRSSAGANQITIDGNGNLYPSTDNVDTLGTSSNRWSNIYGGYVSAIISEASTQTTGEFRNSHSTYGGGVRFRSNNTYGMLQFTTYDN